MTLPNRPLGLKESGDIRSVNPTSRHKFAFLYACVRFWIAVGLCIIVARFPTFAFGEGSRPSIDSIEIGIGKHWKVGYPTPTNITVSNLPTNEQTSFELTTVDSDGVAITYDLPLKCDSQNRATLTLDMKHGRNNRPIVAAIRAESGEVLARREVSTEERGNVLPLKHPWIVAIGKELHLEQAAMRSANSPLSSYTVSNIDSITQVPISEQGYRGISLLVVSTTDFALLQELTTSQQMAIVDWVLQGGNLLVWTGESSVKLKSLPWLEKLIGEEWQGTEYDVEPGTLESFLSSQNKLQPLECASFRVFESIVDINLTTKDRRKLPLLFHRPFGLGRVQVFACDANKKPISDWQDRSLLLAKMLDQQNIDLSQLVTTNQASSKMFGYNDLSNQLRSTLEDFSQVRSAGLATIISIVVAFLLLAIGVDYFLIVRIWRRPSWTWGTLLLWSLFALIGISVLKASWKPASNALNAIEIYDADLETGFQRGRAWVHQYSGQAGIYDINAKARPLLDAKNSGNDSELIPTQISWGGHPGSSLGGFDTSIRTDYGFPGYRFARDVQAEHSSLATSALRGVGITTGGTKSFELEWAPPLIASPTTSTHFSVSRSTDHLEGSWQNPLSEDLLDGILIYRRWMYRLPSKFRGGAIFQVASKDIPKDLSRYLQRKQIVKDVDVGIPWNPHARDDIPRLVEMIMLHEAAGGTGYTGLANEHLRDVELSKLLADKRVLVIGRLARPILDWTAATNGHKIEIAEDHMTTFVRFLIPVSTLK
jgi:hypothetical protein